MIKTVKSFNVHIPAMKLDCLGDVTLCCLHWNLLNKCLQANTIYFTHAKDIAFGTTELSSAKNIVLGTSTPEREFSRSFFIHVVS